MPGERVGLGQARAPRHVAHHAPQQGERGVGVALLPQPGGERDGLARPRAHRGPRGAGRAK